MFTRSAGRTAGFTAALATLVLLSGCAGGGVELGEAQELTLSDEDSNTEATVALAITEVTQESIDFLSDFNLDAEELKQIPYLVRYELEFVEGELGEYDMFGVVFFGKKDTLGAKDAGGADAVPLHLIGGVDGCSPLGSEELAGMSVGETLSGCRVFLAESAEGLSSVSFGKLRWDVTAS